MSTTTASMPSPASARILPNATTYVNNSYATFSPLSLLKLPLDALRQVEIFAFTTLPQNVARVVGVDALVNNEAGREGGTVAAAAIAATASTGAGRIAEGVPEAVVVEGSLNLTDILQAMRRFSGFFSYMTSRWSLACFSVALILNRVTIYASTRRHLSLAWQKRLALRILPIILFTMEILNLLRAMRCQTSPDYSSIRYGRPGKHFSFDHAGGGGFLHALSSTLLGWETDQQSCSAIHMDRKAGSTDIPYGSFSMLWPVFMCLCLSHFVETLSCALQGRAVVTEAGMSIFEHSLAFAEAETMIGQSIGMGMFGLSKSTSPKDDLPLTGDGSSTLHLLTRTQVIEKMNVTPELLLIVLISCCNSLCSNALDVFGKQSRYRLVNTTIWGLCFMGAMAWGFLDSRTLGAETGVLKFPTVCIVGFVPHLLILIGITVCLCIYGLAVLITAFALPADLPQPSSIWERFAWAHENMQGANQIRNVRLNMHEDFYTTLLRIGYAALTAASEAVFLNEGRSVVARRRTWLEDDRLAEIETSRRRTSARTSTWNEPSSSYLENPANFNFDLPSGGNENWESGYGREQKIDKLMSNSRPVQSQASLGGVGAFQGATRCYHGFTFFRGIFYLITRWLLLGLNKLLNRVGITVRPQWMIRLIGSDKKGRKAKTREEPASLDFWILTDDGELQLPEDNEFDVEKELRKRETRHQLQWEDADEARLESKLYNWWTAGGSWGNQDESGDYIPTESDIEDNTSVVSLQTNDTEWEDLEESEGRRTPTQADPFPIARSRESTPLLETLLDTSSLARLLDPRDQESKHEARILAAHLTAGKEGRIMTRSRFRSQVERERAKILMPARYQSSSSDSVSNEKARPTPEEEAEILEKLIISRRHEPAPRVNDGGQKSWETGAAGLGNDGPQCVICQTCPRSIITWPCRCLCVCEDCRVSLAMNNFGSCVTCRQEVSGFVRLWVP